jgi:hypothetical protein
MATIKVTRLIPHYPQLRVGEMMHVTNWLHNGNVVATSIWNKKDKREAVLKRGEYEEIRHARE